jgi:hypothetical protein
MRARFAAASDIGFGFTEGGDRRSYEELRQLDTGGALMRVDALLPADVWFGVNSAT